MLEFFGLRPSILPRLVSTCEVYGHITYGSLAGVPIGSLAADQQGALIGNKCLRKGEVKCSYGTGAFLLFCTGSEMVKSRHGLISTVSGFLSPISYVAETACRLHIKQGPMPSPFMHWKAAVSAFNKRLRLSQLRHVQCPSLEVRSSGCGTA